MTKYWGSILASLVTLAVLVGCYTLNLTVSAERASVERLKLQLVADARAIRNLEAEVRTRARLPEMQRWNDVLQMAAPAAGQYLRSPLQLAAYGAPAEAPTLRYAVVAPVINAVPVDNNVRIALAQATPREGTAAIVSIAYAPKPKSLAADLDVSLAAASAMAPDAAASAPQ